MSTGANTVPTTANTGDSSGGITKAGAPTAAPTTTVSFTGSIIGTGGPGYIAQAAFGAAGGPTPTDAPTAEILALRQRWDEAAAGAAEQIQAAAVAKSPPPPLYPDAGPPIKAAPAALQHAPPPAAAGPPPVKARSAPAQARGVTLGGTVTPEAERAQAMQSDRCTAQYFNFIARTEESITEMAAHRDSLVMATVTADKAITGLRNMREGASVMLGQFNTSAHECTAAVSKAQAAEQTLRGQLAEALAIANRQTELLRTEVAAANERVQAQERAANAAREAAKEEYRTEASAFVGTADRLAAAHAANDRQDTELHMARAAASYARGIALGAMDRLQLELRNRLSPAATAEVLTEVTGHVPANNQDVGVRAETIRSYDDLMDRLTAQAAAAQTARDAAVAQGGKPMPETRLPVIFRPESDRINAWVPPAVVDGAAVTVGATVMYHYSKAPPTGVVVPPPTAQAHVRQQAREELTAAAAAAVPDEEEESAAVTADAAPVLEEDTAGSDTGTVIAPSATAAFDPTADAGPGLTDPWEPRSSETAAEFRAARAADVAAQCALLAAQQTVPTALPVTDTDAGPWTGMTESSPFPKAPEGPKAQTLAPTSRQLLVRPGWITREIATGGAGGHATLPAVPENRQASSGFRAPTESDLGPRSVPRAGSAVSSVSERVQFIQDGDDRAAPLTADDPVSITGAASTVVEGPDFANHAGTAAPSAVLGDDVEPGGTVLPFTSMDHWLEWTEAHEDQRLLRIPASTPRSDIASPAVARSQCRSLTAQHKLALARGVPTPADKIQYYTEMCNLSLAYNRMSYTDHRTPPNPKVTTSCLSAACEAIRVARKPIPPFTTPPPLSPQFIRQIFGNVCEALTLHKIPSARLHGTGCVQEVYQRWLTGGLAEPGNGAPTASDRLGNRLPSHVKKTTPVDVELPFGDGLSEADKAELFRLAAVNADSTRGEEYQRRFAADAGSAGPTKAPPPTHPGAGTVAAVAAGVMAKMAPTTPPPPTAEVAATVARNIARDRSSTASAVSVASSPSVYGSIIAPPPAPGYDAVGLDANMNGRLTEDQYRAEPHRIVVPSTDLNPEWFVARARVAARTDPSWTSGTDVIRDDMIFDRWLAWFHTTELMDTMRPPSTRPDRVVASGIVTVTGAVIYRSTDADGYHWQYVAGTRPDRFHTAPPTIRPPMPACRAGVHDHHPHVSRTEYDTWLNRTRTDARGAVLGIDDRARASFAQEPGEVRLEVMEGGPVTAFGVRNPSAALQSRIWVARVNLGLHTRT